MRRCRHNGQAQKTIVTFPVTRCSSEDFQQTWGKIVDNLCICFHVLEYFSCNRFWIFCLVHDYQGFARVAHATWGMLIALQNLVIPCKSGLFSDCRHNWHDAMPQRSHRSGTDFPENSFVCEDYEPRRFRELTSTSHLIAPHGGELINLIVDPARAAELKSHSKGWPSWDLTGRQVCDLELLL